MHDPSASFVSLTLVVNMKSTMTKTKMARSATMSTLIAKLDPFFLVVINMLYFFDGAFLF